MPAYHARASFEAQNTASTALIIATFHFEVDTLTSPPNWGSIASDISTWLAAPWRAILSTADTFNQIVVTDENYPGSTHGQGVASVASAGLRTLSDTSFSPGICGMLSYKTATAKRYARGHTFMPPAYSSAAGSAGGGWAGANTYTSAIVTFLQTLAPGHTAGSTSYIPEVFSRTRAAAGLTPFAFPFTAVFNSPKQHFLRSRVTAP